MDEELKKDKELSMSKFFKKHWDEIKSVWEEHRGKKSLKGMYEDYLMGKVFPVEEWDHQGKYWMTFLARASHWEKEKRAKELKEEADTITDEEILEVQDRNRRMMILLLREALNHYQQDPQAFKKLTVSKINRLYKTVQQAEEAARRTKIKVGQLQVDAVKTFFPYQRLSFEALKKMKNKFNEGINQVLELKQGGADEQSTPGFGGE